nr:hypothetical protein PDK3.020 [Rhodococcus sp. DK17]
MTIAGFRALPTLSPSIPMRGLLNTATPAKMATMNPAVVLETPCPLMRRASDQVTNPYVPQKPPNPASESSIRSRLVVSVFQAEGRLPSRFVARWLTTGPGRMIT